MKIVCIISPYYDYLTATLMEGLQELGHEIVSSESSNYTTKTSDKQLRRCAENADLIIVGSNRKVRHWLVEGVENINKIFVDGDDSQEFKVPSHILFKAVFKRELNRFWMNIHDEPVYPLPFAAEKRYFRGDLAKIRDISVSFSANLDANVIRHSVSYRLKKIGSAAIFCGNTGERAYLSAKSVGMPIDTPKYRDVLFRSQIGVSVAGAGYDCARYWEILAAGALLMTQELDIVIPNQFEDGVNCVVFKSLDEFEAKLEELMSDPVKVRRISELGYAHLLRYHTSVARASYFLDLACRDTPKSCQSFYSGTRDALALTKRVWSYFKRIC